MHAVGQVTRSTAMATASPPPMQREATPIFAPRQINRPPMDRGEHERQRRRRAVADSLPTFHHGFLHEVLRIGLGSGLLPGKEQQLGRVISHPAPPLNLCRGFSHRTRIPAVQSLKRRPAGFLSEEFACQGLDSQTRQMFAESGSVPGSAGTPAGGSAHNDRAGRDAGAPSLPDP